ncbi:MAG: folate-binding protein [Burkholderiaceae bacterium]
MSVSNEGQTPPSPIATVAELAAMPVHADDQRWLIGAPAGPTPPPWRMALAEIGVIRVRGPQAAEFLNGQLTSAIDRLAPGHVGFSAWCSPKGRMLASLWVAVLAADHFELLLSRELVTPIARRLKMFVLRAKVTVEALEDALVPIALLTPAQPLPLRSLDAPMSVSPDGEVLRLRDVQIGDARLQRHLWLPPLAQWQDRWQALDFAHAVPGDWFRAAEILAGEARVIGATSERFVPQMVNFELLGGVDFDKGCYAGQEVIARSQNLSRLKRRALPVLCKNKPDPGSDLLDANGQPVATVVDQAPATIIGRPDQWLALLETTDDAARAGQAAELGISACEALDLPYAIPEHRPFERPRF